MPPAFVNLYGHNLFSGMITKARDDEAKIVPSRNAVLLHFAPQKIKRIAFSKEQLVMERYEFFVQFETLLQ